MRDMDHWDVEKFKKQVTQNHCHDATSMDETRVFHVPRDERGMLEYWDDGAVRC
jgi:hypothetical protein